MTIRIISFTKKGRELAESISGIFLNDETELYEKKECTDELVKSSFDEKMPLVFIGALGIAVRKTAPYIKDKTKDCPVVVIDETGRYVIPVLSGHIGGANTLALKIAEKIGGEPVITTATDINGCFAVDVFATEMGLRIVNPQKIKEVSKKVLEGEDVFAAAHPKLGRSYMEQARCRGVKEADYYRGNPDIIITDKPCEMQDALILKPKRLVLGIGCKKGKTFEKIKQAFELFLNDAGADEGDILSVASIDIKKDEKGIIALSNSIGAPFLTYTADELMAIGGVFTSSNFVKETVGTDNVCERAAVIAAGEGGEIIQKKTSYDGITFALAKIKAD